MYRADQTQNRLQWNGEGPPRRVLIVRALQVGDLLCSVPAFRALRAALPESEIVLLGLPWAGSFVARFARYLDGFREFPGYPGLSERQPRLREIPAFLIGLQNEHFDVAIQMHGSGGVLNPLTVRMGARLNAGFFLPGQYCPDEERFFPYPSDLAEIHRNLALLEFLGIPSRGEHLEFPLSREDQQALEAIEATAGLRPGEYVCVHAGARSAARRWRPEGFAAVADSLAARGLRVVLTGSLEEAQITAAVAAAMKAPSINLAGDPRFSLGALGALISNARLVVTNDTAVSHMAAAVRVPSVVIFTASDPRRWAPLDRSRHAVLFHPIGHPCAARVTAEAVIREADKLLRSHCLAEMS